MPLFTSPREKQLWIWVMLVLVAIFSVLFVGLPLLEYFEDQNIQAIIFLAGMLLVAAAMIFHGLKVKPGKMEITIWLGLIAVYLMFFLRLGLAERSHLIEYSVLAIFIHKALLERMGSEVHFLKPASIAWIATLLVGILDECIQIFLPDRVFDPVDIFFNGFAGLTAIITFLILRWIRKKYYA